MGRSHNDVKNKEEEKQRKHISTISCLDRDLEVRDPQRDREKNNERERGMKREEIPIVGGFSLHLLVFFQSIFLLFVSGLADDPSGSKNGIKAESHPTSGSSTGLRVLFIFLGLLAVVLFSIFLFKLYQKKKREEQHARLLRLFEEDDELELELGLRE